MGAIAAPHTFASVDAEGRLCVVRSEGNPDTHIILRGGKGGCTNYDADSIDVAVAAVGTLKDTGRGTAVMIDCSHANAALPAAGSSPPAGVAATQAEQQVLVARHVAASVGAGNGRIMGLMLESFIEEGKQAFVPGLQVSAALYTNGIIHIHFTFTSHSLHIQCTNFGTSSEIYGNMVHTFVYGILHLSLDET